MRRVAFPSRLYAGATRCNQAIFAGFKQTHAPVAPKRGAARPAYGFQPRPPAAALQATSAQFDPPRKVARVSRADIWTLSIGTFLGYGTVTVRFAVSLPAMQNVTSSWHLWPFPVSPGCVNHVVLRQSRFATQQVLCSSATSNSSMTVVISRISSLEEAGAATSLLPCRLSAGSRKAPDGRFPAICALIGHHHQRLAVAAFTRVAERDG